jgi:predicted MPP superfamily phosphohydrolase
MPRCEKENVFLKAWPVLAVAVVQSFLCLAHWFMYWTWIEFWWPMSPDAVRALRVSLSILSLIFIVATLAGFRLANPVVRLFYWIAALWMGLANFLFVAVGVAWLADLVLRLFVPPATRVVDRHYIAGVLLILAVATAAYGLANARILRLRRIKVELPNLPACWRDKQALLISDTHLGHINGVGFAKRVAQMARDLNPAIVFLAGDLFDGSKVDPLRIAAPILALKPPLGIYFVGGNHEEFGGAKHFEEVLRDAGVRVLHNESALVDGLRIVGVPYGHSTYPIHLRAFLESLHLKNGSPSILLNHVPNRLPLAEHAGVSLQLSGHTHGGGQMFPFNFITRRAFGKFTYGLQRFGDMQVYTSSGAGTWGPPMRVGTHSEIVLLSFA